MLGAFPFRYIPHGFDHWFGRLDRELNRMAHE
jgi:hypothetical protein